MYHVCRWLELRTLGKGQCTNLIDIIGEKKKSYITTDLEFPIEIPVASLVYGALNYWFRSWFCFSPDFGDGFINLSLELGDFLIVSIITRLNKQYTFVESLNSIH
jgi:hypothetical protein